MAYHADLPDVCDGLQAAVPALAAVVKELPVDARPTQPYMRAFRALCAIVDADHDELVSQTRAYPWLLVSVGLWRACACDMLA